MKTARVGDHVAFLSGFAFKSNRFNTEGNGLPIVRIRDVLSGKSDTFYSGDYDDRYVVNLGDCLIGMDGEFNLSHWRSGKALLNQRVCKIDEVSPEIDRGYLARFLTLALKQIEAATPYVTVKHLSVKTLSDTLIPLPPLPEQKRIAAVLDAADALRLKRRESIEQLDLLTHAHFLEMFGDPVENPMGWRKEPLGKILRIRRGGSPRPIDKYLGGTVNWVKISDATSSDNDLYITSCADRISEAGLSKTTLLEPGSFIFANSGVSLGFARILKIQGAIHDGWLAFDEYSTDQLSPLFFLKALNSITHYFRRIAPAGTQPNLNTSLMKAFELILPPIDLQGRFAAFVDLIESHKARLKAQSAELESLFACLQFQAFSGAPCSSSLLRQHASA